MNIKVKRRVRDIYSFSIRENELAISFVLGGGPKRWPLSRLLYQSNDVLSSMSSSRKITSSGLDLFCLIEAPSKSATTLGGTIVASMVQAPTLEGGEKKSKSFLFLQL